MRKVIILSGGMDSAVLLATLKKESHAVTCLTFNYGAKHNARENECAGKLAAHYGMENVVVHLGFVGQLFKSDLLISGGEIPEGHYEDPTMKQTVVPFRNGIMLSIAAGLAESIDAEAICYGAHAGDHAIYPDCREQFMLSMRRAISLGTYKQIRLEAPFVALTKRDIALIGHNLDVPFDITYSCYKGGEKHCGKCGACTERREALFGFDTTEYED